MERMKILGELRIKIYMPLRVDVSAGQGLARSTLGPKRVARVLAQLSRTRQVCTRAHAHWSLPGLCATSCIQLHVPHVPHMRSLGPGNASMTYVPVLLTAMCSHQRSVCLMP